MGREQLYQTLVGPLNLNKRFNNQPNKSKLISKVANILFC